jgi:hypothetical protein
MKQTLPDECFRVQGRTKWYEGPDQIQRDLDVFMAFYNFQRTHQGYRVAGRTRPRPSTTSSPPIGPPATDFRRGPGGAARQLLGPDLPTVPKRNRWTSIGTKAQSFVRSIQRLRTLMHLDLFPCAPDTWQSTSSGWRPRELNDRCSDGRRGNVWVSSAVPG